MIKNLFAVFFVCSVAVFYFSCNSSPTSLGGEKTITSFSLSSPAADTGIIDETAKTIVLHVPEGTNLTTLVANFTTTGKSVLVGPILQVSGVSSNDFSNPVTYTVRAADNSTVNYTVTVKVVIVPKAITSFSFVSPAITGVINDSAKTIVLNLPDTSTDVTALIATFATTGASISVGSALQTSAVTPNDFTEPVVYTVTGSDNTTAKYTVIVQKPATWISYDWTDTVQAPTGWGEENSMNSYCTVSNGILSFNSGAAINQAHYRYYFDSAMAIGSKMSIVIKAKADSTAGSYAWVLDFENQYRGQLEIRNGQINLLNGSASLGTAAVSLSAWHTYLISVEMVATGLQMKVYVDGSARAAASGIASGAASGLYIRLGDLSGNNSFSGSLDWIMWTFSGAYAPGIGLPSGFSLIP
jgi:hypothetical protein